MKKALTKIGIVVALMLASVLVIVACNGHDEFESLTVTTQPTRTTYYVGENFSPAGMVITAVFAGETENRVIPHADLAITPDRPLQATDSNVRVAYTYRNTERFVLIPITVNAAPVDGQLQSLVVTAQPTRTTYAAGDSFEPAGMVITATFVGDTPNRVVPNASLTITPNRPLQATDTNVRVSYTYEGVTRYVDVPVTVTAAPVDGQLVSLTVTTPPTRTAYYVGVDFDPAGMVITAAFSGETADRVVPNANLTITPNRPLIITDTSVRVAYTYNNVTRYVDITITVALYSPATTTRLEGFIADVVDLLDMAGILPEDALDYIADALMAVFLAPQFTDAELNAWLDFIEDTIDGENSEMIGPIGILFDFLELDIPNVKIATFVTAGLFAAGEIVEVLLDDEDFYGGSWLDMAGDAFAILEEIGKQNIITILTAVLDLADVVAGADWLWDLIFAGGIIDMPERPEFIALVLTVRDDALAVLNILSDELIEALVDVAAVFVPLFVEAEFAEEVIEIIDIIAEMAGAFRDEAIAVLNLIDEAFAGAIYDLITAIADGEYQDATNFALIMTARVLYAQFGHIDTEGDINEIVEELYVILNFLYEIGFIQGTHFEDIADEYGEIIIAILEDLAVIAALSFGYDVLDSLYDNEFVMFFLELFGTVGYQPPDDGGSNEAIRYIAA